MEVNQTTLTRCGKVDQEESERVRDTRREDHYKKQEQESNDQRNYSITTI